MTLITGITRGSLHDGPGIRTVVYYKGCPLSCRWCHNPETIAPGPEILYYPQKCIGCGRCQSYCGTHHAMREGEHSYFPAKTYCPQCGQGAKACPAEALILCGEEKTPRQLFAEIEKDKAYYALSGGGVTLSGGECLLHPAHVKELLSLCQGAGIHTAVESALHVPWENIREVLPFCNLFLADIKLSDDARHREFCGLGNRRILENLFRLAGQAKIWVRVPFIPGVNDSRENLLATARIIKDLGKAVEKVEVLAYNTLAKGKYEAAGKEYTSFGATQAEEEVLKAQKLLTGETG